MPPAKPHDALAPAYKDNDFGTPLITLLATYNQDRLAIFALGALRAEWIRSSQRRSLSSG